MKRMSFLVGLAIGACTVIVVTAIISIIQIRHDTNMELAAIVAKYEALSAAADQQRAMIEESSFAGVDTASFSPAALDRLIANYKGIQPYIDPTLLSGYRNYPPLPQNWLTLPTDQDRLLKTTLMDSLSPSALLSVFPNMSMMELDSYGYDTVMLKKFTEMMSFESWYEK